METHAAQDIQLVLMHAGEDPLASGGGYVTLSWG